MDLQLARALANPLRMEILNSLSEEASSPKRLARALGQDLAQISYHTAVLARSGCIRVAATRQHRAAVERFYELTPIVSSGHLTRNQVPAAARGYVSASILQSILDRGVAALEAETLDARADSHLGCMSVVLDEEGWRDVAGIVADAVERIESAQAASSKRLAGADRRRITATVAFANFESP